AGGRPGGEHLHVTRVRRRASQIPAPASTTSTTIPAMIHGVAEVPPAVFVAAGAALPGAAVVGAALPGAALPGAALLGWAVAGCSASTGAGCGGSGCPACGISIHRSAWLLPSVTTDLK